MRRSHFIAGGAALAAAASARPARAQYSNSPFRQQLTIAVNVPLSGPLASYGRQIVAGVRAAIDYNNRYAAPLERVFAIRTFDDENAIAIAITNAQFAAGDLTVIATIGNLTADVTLGTLPEYSNDGMPLIVPASTADSITSRGYRNVFRLPTKDTTEGQLFASAILPGIKPKLALAVLQDGGGYGVELAQGFVAMAKTQKLAAEAVAFPASNPDYAKAAAAIVARNPEYLFLAGKLDAMGPLIPALIAAGYAGRFGLGEGFYDPQTIARYGSHLNGAIVATSFAPLKRAPGDFAILSELNAQIGDVTAFSAYGYASAQIAMSAVKRTNAADRGAALQALLSGTTYETMTGSYAFDFNGDAINPNVYFYSIGKDGFKYEKPAHPTGFVL